MGINEIIKIGDRLRTLRLQKELTQKELAELIGIPRTTYANYEANKREPSLDVLNNIADKLNITLNDILINNFVNKSDDEERLSILAYKIGELAARYSFEEIKEATRIAEERIVKGLILISEEKPSKAEEMDILVGSFSANERPDELAEILAIKAAYNLPDSFYIKYFEGLATDEIISKLSTSLNSSVFGDEEEAWEILYNALGFLNCLHIIENSDIYIDEYIKVTHSIDNINDILYKNFSKIHVDDK